MMQNPETPWYFQVLDIPLTDDIRQIKRAYAVALKRIDLDSEQPAFERLRRAFELAQEWRADENDFDDSADEVEDTDDEGDEGRDESDEEAQQLSSPESPPAASSASPLPLDYGRRPPVGDTLLSPVPPPPTAPPADSATDPIPLDYGQRLPSRNDAHADSSPAAAELPRLPDEAQQQQALDEWMKLFEGGSASYTLSVLQDAQRDPRLAHLDAQVALEERVGELLRTSHNAPLNLLEAANQCFGWNADIRRLDVLSPDTRQWIEQVLKAETAWKQQSADAREHQQNLLKIALKNRPGPRDAVVHLAGIENLAQQFPLWFRLRVPKYAWDAWQAARARARKHPLFWVAIRKGQKSVYNLAYSVVIGSFVGMFLLSWVIFFFSMSRSEAPESREMAQVNATNTSGSGLSYQFRGEPDKDNCAQAHQFAHESNWRSIDDAGARFSFEQFIIACADKGVWPGGENDAIVSMLRQIRSDLVKPAAALVPTGKGPAK